MKLSAEKILEFQHSLVNVLYEQGSLQDLLNIAHAQFLRPMFIKGDGSMIYAITENYSPDVHPNWITFLKNLESRSPEFESVRTVSEDPEFRQAFSQKKAAILYSPSYKGMVLHANVWLNNTRICEIVALEHNRPFSEADSELMDLFVQYVELHVSINRDRYQSSADLAKTLIALLENQSVSPLELLNINTRTGWNVDDELAVILADTPAQNDTPLLAVFRDKLKNTFRNSVTFLYKNHVVSIVNITKTGGYHTVSRLIDGLSFPESLHCGLSFEYTGLERSMEFFRLAQLACSIAAQQNCKFIDMYHAAHIRISERIHTITDLQDLIHPDLIRLDRLDPQRTSHYLETLYAFLLCGGNYTDTANYLGLHRNSLIYRMNRIQSIINSDLNDVHNKHFLLISYLLMGISFS